MERVNAEADKYKEAAAAGDGTCTETQDLPVVSTLYRDFSTLWGRLTNRDFNSTDFHSPPTLHSGEGVVSKATELPGKQSESGKLNAATGKTVNCNCPPVKT